MPTRLTLPPNPRSIRSLLDDEGQALDRVNPTPYTPRNCLTCLGRKEFRWLDPATREPADYECSCVDQYLLHRFLSHSGVPLNYQRLGWADHQYLDEATAKVALDYIERQEGYVSSGFGLVFSGSKGNGKTLLAYLLVKGLIEAGVPCFCTSFAGMIEAFAGGWKDKKQEVWFNRTVRNTRVLYLDDVGREYRADRFAEATKTEDKRREAALADNRPGSMRETLLEDVIRHRVGNCLPTIISTNYTEDEILKGYGGHTMSLLGEKSFFTTVTGQDRRNEMRQREQQYVIDGLRRPVVLA